MMPLGSPSEAPSKSGVDRERKWRRILTYLARGGRLTRFDAEKLGDHALNSTVSNLQAMGVEIAREPLTLEGRFGKVYCKRYWLAADQRDRARQLLGQL